MSTEDRSSRPLNPNELPEEQPTMPETPGAAAQPAASSESAAFSADQEAPTLPTLPPVGAQSALPALPAGVEGSSTTEQVTLPGGSGALNAREGSSVQTTIASSYAGEAFAEQPPPDMQTWPTPSGALPATPGTGWPMPSGPLPQPGQQAYQIVGQVAMTPSGMVIVPLAGATKPPWYRVLAKPLPFWARAAGVALIVAGLVVFFFARLGQGSDWADSLRDTGLAAGGLAAFVLLATLVRALAGLAARSNPMRRSQLVSASILLGVLLIFAGEGVGLQSPVHYFQAATLENQQQWEQALAEYQLAGQRPPDSDALARVYVEWGEQLSAGRHYMDAISKFEMAMNTYPKASTEVSRAQRDEVNTYFTWADVASQQQNYQEATSHYDTLLDLPYCKQSCQDQASRLDATAYYNLAEQYLSGHQYQEAVNAFQAIQTRFGSSPEAQKIHLDWAKALLGLGQQQRASSICSSAIPTYDELIQQFGDTPEGQQALSDYNAPEPVTGRFLGALAYLGGVPVAFLAKGLYNGIPDSQFFQIISNSPFALIDASGHFAFKPQPQGTYDLAWGSVDSQGNAVVQFDYHTDTGQPYYVATVGPLCPYDFGDIPDDVP